MASSFGDHAQDIAKPLRNAVLVDLVRRRQVSRESCLQLLRLHIKENTWQVSNSHTPPLSVDWLEALSPEDRYPSRLQDLLLALLDLLRCLGDTAFVLCTKTWLSTSYLSAPLARGEMFPDIIAPSAVY